MIMLLYDIALHLSLTVFLPYLFFKRITKGKYKSGIGERFGFFEPGRFDSLGSGGEGRSQGHKILWFHGVSVGETKAIMPLLKRFKEKNENCKILFSTVTPTGQAVAREEGAGFVDVLMYFPMDFAWVVTKVLDLVKPDIFIVVEKEVWPNIVSLLKERGVPVVVANGSISSRSFSNYKKLSMVFKPTFERISKFCAQTKKDGDRALMLGLPEGNLTVTGNIKFDMSPVELTGQEKNKLLSLLGFSTEDIVFTAGSTHKGEEDKVLEVFGNLKKQFPELKLIIAPRHPERFREVESLIKESGHSYICRSSEGADGGDIVLLDTLGELVKIYSVSSICFVGGTLVPIGGHNLMEPSYFGKPVLYGSFLKSYLYMAEMLEDGGGSIRVSGESGLKAALKDLLENKDKISIMGRAGKEVVLKSKGATDKTIEVIESFLI